MSSTLKKAENENINSLIISKNWPKSVSSMHECMPWVLSSGGVDRVVDACDFEVKGVVGRNGHLQFKVAFAPEKPSRIHLTQ